MILGTQYLDSGKYTLTLEKSTSMDLTSYVYTKFGTFRIVPISDDIQDYGKLERYDVYIDDGLIGSAAMPTTDQNEDFDAKISQTMASAIDIVTTKINELVDREELAVLSKIIASMFDSINLTEEQKAMYRTFIIENDKLDDVIQEMDDPTDILGENGS